MQYILNETEYQAFQDLKEENAKLAHKLEVSRKTREMDRRQIDELSRVRDLDNKKLAKQAHELLVKDAELADFSSRFRLSQAALKEQNEKVATLSSALREAKRDCECTSQVLKETKAISAARLNVVNHLTKEVRRLKSEHVCVAQNPKTGTVKVISVVKADTYRQFGWTVSEEYLVDRPA